jgi:hypothetical protein
MKKLIFALSAFLISIFLIAQEIPKKANTIIITDSLSQEQFFSKINDILFESGYGILNSDKGSGTITTTPKPIKAGSVKLNILIKDKKVSIRGELQGFSMDLGGIIDNSPLIIDYRGMKNSPTMKAWDEMFGIAQLISGTKEYLIK